MASTASTAGLDCDVVVVGAGLAGLTAAHELTSRGLDARVIEARERVGGRTLNHAVGERADQVVELGGQWVGPTQHEVLALAAELGLELHPTHGDGASLFEGRSGRISRFTGAIPRLNPVALADIGQAQLRLGRLAGRVSTEMPWASPGAERLDSQTFATWIRRAARTATAREGLAAACRAVFAVEPAEISLLHVLFYIRSAGDWDALLEVEGGAQQDRIVGGSQLLSLGLADRLGERVELERPVSRIRRLEGGVVAQGPDGGEVGARRAIVAVPPALAARIEFHPPLPSPRDRLTQRMGMGSVIKCMALYDEPFWRAEGLSGQAFSLPGPAQVIFDNSPPSGSPGVLLAFLEAAEARRIGAMPEHERRNLVVGTLARLFGPRAAGPAGYVERDWSADPWARGCYAGVLGPGGWTGYGHSLRRPVDRIHWAGTETATRWMGYFDGAIQSGRRAAREVAEAIAG